MLWATLNATKQRRKLVHGMRSTNGRSRLFRECISMFCFHLLQCLFLLFTNQQFDEFPDFGGFERFDLV